MAVTTSSEVRSATVWRTCWSWPTRPLSTSTRPISSLSRSVLRGCMGSYGDQQKERG